MNTIVTKNNDSNSIYVETVCQKDLSGTREKLEAKIRSAARDGFFYLELPEECKRYLPAAISFANSFYKNQEMREMVLPGWSGYRAEEHSQREHFFCERSLWDQVLDEEVKKFAEILSDTCHKILTTTLSIFNVPENQWNEVTGGLTSHEGMEHFSFNHYRDSVQKIGVKIHRDFGAVTALFIESKGLEALIRNKQWVPINPKDGYLVINFGRALETLINRPEEFQASWHKVNQVFHDRISFGLFTDNKSDSSIYKMTESGPVIVHQNYTDFLNDCFAETYAE